MRLSFSTLKLFIMKKILIALDYNPSAERIAEIGHELAKAMKATTILLHVVSDSSYYTSFDYSPIMGFGGFSNVVETDSNTELMNRAQLYLDKSKQHLSDEMIQTVVKSGNPGETILKTATGLGADLIVMGTHSRRGVEKLLLGSVAEKVLHHTSLPVFIIPIKSVDE
jgi:nucleotide-binding universal stress UspA family protein